MFFAGKGKAGENKNLSVLIYAEVFWWARVDCASRAEKEPGSRLPAAASCLGRHAHPAGRSPNSSSLFLPLAAVVAVAQGLFYPPDCSAGRCCSNPPSRVRLKMPSKTKNQRNFYAGFFGGRGWITQAALLKTAHWAVFALSSATAPQLFEYTLDSETQDFM